MDNIKVLMVDDESRMRKLVSDFLTRKGYIVIEAGDGEEALDRFYADKDISLVILDVMMPKMNGWDVCREIRKNSKVPIIMLTAKSDESSELNGFECGADEYIAKPFSPKILTARVDALIRRSYSIDSSEIIDVGGIIIIALFYSGHIAFEPLLISLIVLALLYVGGKFRVHNRLFFYIGGFIVWLLFLESGIHK